MFELFSDIFTYRDNMLLRVDARVKLLVVLAGLAAIMLSRRMPLPLAFFALCTAAMPALGIPFRLVLARFAAPAGMALLLIALKTFLTGNAVFLAIGISSWQLNATQDGLAQGLLLGARVLGAVSLVLLLGFVTPAYRIFQAFRWFGVPEAWLDVAVLVYRYIFVLLDRTADLAAAQRLRLGFTGIRRSLATLGMLAGATFLNSFEQALRVHESMRLRCYSGAMRFGALPALKRRDGLIAVLSLGTLLAAYFLAERSIAP